MFQKILLYSLFFALFIACKEDKDEVYPTILISSPAENSQFDVLDLVPVRASINDNEKVVLVEISLRSSSSGNRVLNSIVLNPNTSFYELDQLFYLSDSLMESGQYSIRIDAGDGENTASAFVSVNIQGIRRESIGLVAALDQNTNVDLVNISESQNVSSFSTLPSCGEIAINSRYQQLWYTMPDQGKIGCYNLKQNALVFETFPNSNAQSDAILDALQIGDRFYVSTDRSTVQAFSPNFQDVFTYQGPQGYRVEDLYPIGNRLMVKEVDGLGNNQSLLYLFNNGNIDTRSANSDDIFGYGARESDPSTAFEFINLLSDMEVRIFNLNNGLSTFLINKANVNLNSLIQIREYEYLLIGNSQVFQYNLSTNFMRSLASGLSSPKVAYDEVDKVVYIASGSSLRAVNYETAALIYQTNLSAPIIDLAVRYNR